MCQAYGAYGVRSGRAGSVLPLAHHREDWSDVAIQRSRRALCLKCAAGRGAQRRLSGPEGRGPR